MRVHRAAVVSALLVLGGAVFARAAEPSFDAVGAAGSALARHALAAKLPLVGLPPARRFPNLCVLHYRISTVSPECQEFFDQGLGYFYSYAWMEAARSLETAARQDPRCAMAWWGLARALEHHGKRDAATRALLRANELKAHASHREQQLIKASMQETGNEPGVGNDDARKKAATATIDNLLALYPDDEEAWIFRAKLAGGSGFGGVVSAVPFYLALLRVNPLHPGANHELVHFYETYRRPALGWTYAENYIASSPGLPHPFHMQAHLATRIGRWDKTGERSARAIELHRAYHQAMKVKPKDDAQFSHHLEILLLSLVHDGQFKAARALKAEAESAGIKHLLPWFRLHLAERDWPAALSIADQHKKDKVTAAYLRAVVYLRQGDAGRALPEIQVLQEAFRGKKEDKQLEYRLWETLGTHLCLTGNGEQGLKLLAKAADRSKDDYGHHAWGNGSYYMEAWGTAALQANRLDAAEEAFLEALAHDPGSVRAALGLQVVCERLQRTEEARRYAALAQRCWGRADPGRLTAELAWLQKCGRPATS